MKYLHLEIDSSIAEEEASYALQNAGYTFLYALEGKSTTLAIGWIDEYATLKEQFSWIAHIEEQTYEGIDWSDQWNTHCEGYEDGQVSISLEKYGGNGSFRMSPGPGFGDLSHPTTRLILRLGIPHFSTKNVVDVGCGSGVLALAALSCKAKHVWAIDIENIALQHTLDNACLNGVEKSIACMRPEELSFANAESVPWLLLMNMIHSEQCVAWESISTHFNNRPFEIITSGILIKDREQYLKQTEEWGWKLIDEAYEDQWVSFHFLHSV